MPRLRGSAILSALPTILKQQSLDDAYNNYIAECLRIMTENTARYAGGRFIEFSFDDIVSPKPQKSAEEIVEGIKSKFRGD